MEFAEESAPTEGKLVARGRQLRQFRAMPAFDIVSEVDRMEVKNAIVQAERELVSRFDFKGVHATIELDPKSGSILLSVDDAARLKALREIIINKLAKRGIDLRNVEHKDPDISPLGHSRQELAIKQGLDGDKAREITKAIKTMGLKVQAALQDRQVRVTGNKKDDLQKVIAALRREDFGVGLSFKNFRD
jgi:uncharacterized protein YajQ (UPF0234 family)